MACRYPDADTVEQLFENSLAQRRAFRKIPNVRLAASGYFDDSGKSGDRAYTRQAAVINGFEFDRGWFRVPRASFEVTDMTNWLALTVARETIDDIRFRKDGTHANNDAVRVVVGNTLTGEFARANLMRLRWPYVRGVVEQHLRDEQPHLDDDERTRLLRDLEVRYKRPFPVLNEDSLAGGLANTIAGRICNHFDFKGGGYTLDGACSSSLLAVTDACSALAAGDADMVLAGGVDLSLDPFELVGFSRTMALARNEMLVYDEQSEGFWPGEGCGFVALMRYSDALEQCEHIHAVIHGWGISSDGQGGLTRPEFEGQMLALQRCYKRAGYGIESVGYFEGHGTGTKVGDAAELQALINARRNSGKPIHPAVISSIKANIGHTKAAAGLAGLLRATKCISDKILPPTTACRQPHRLFADHADNLMPADRSQIWESDKLERRAGISAMGFGGINTHITIAEAPPPRTSVAVFGANELARLQRFQDAELFLFAAARPDDLAWTIDHVAGFANDLSRAELTDLATELARRATRGALSPWKAAIVAATPAELCRKLELLRQALASCQEHGADLSMDEGVFVSARSKRGAIGLVFSGQGAPARARGGVHARRFDEVQRVYQQAGLEAFASRDDTDFAQPAIAAASLGGLEVLRRIGVRGEVAIGHSLGELAALHWAGHFDGDTLLAIAKARGKAMVEDPNTVGAMAAIAADRDETAVALGGQEHVFIANINSPTQTVVSGRRAEVEALIARLRSEGVGAKLLSVRQAFHTPAMARVSTVFGAKLDPVHFDGGQRKVISAVTGRPLPTDTNIATYLRDQLVSPVHFLSAASLAAKEVDLFIEVGPGHLLTNLTHSICDTPAISLDVGGASLAPLLRAAAAAYVLDCAPMIGSLFGDRFARRFDWSWTPKFFQNPCELFPGAPGPDYDLEATTATEFDVQSNATDANSDTRARLRQIIADHTGLPAWTLQDSSRMLSELHLNSITVGEIVARLTASGDQLRPLDPTEYADASISEIAAAVDQLEEFGVSQQSELETAPSGVDTWVRYFAMTSEPALRPERRADLVRGKWEGFGAVEQREYEVLHELNAGPHASGVVIWLSDEPATHDLSPLLQAAQRCAERSEKAGERLYFVVVQHGWGAGGFARSFFLEQKTVSALVINLPALQGGDHTDCIAEEIDAARPGFSEVFIGTAGERETPHMRLVQSPPSVTQGLIDENDVVLVTGGGKGISAECGYQLARRTGCALLILGRTRPQDSIELSDNLKRMHAANLRVSYQLADVTVATHLADAVSAGIAELGSPVTGIVHGAGLNVPRAVANLSVANLESVVAPKVDGLRNSLAAVDPARLKVLVTFSSIIARIGLHGEADYALANEWLSHETETFQSRHPNCRCRAIEWSVWSGTGMGQRLGRLDILERQGIAALSTDDGVREFLRLVETPDLPVGLIVAGRFGDLPTVVFDRPPLAAFRFLDSIPVYYPETELISECRLSPESDSYLDDHVLNGERLLPAVMALEAMTEAAVALMGKDAGAVTPLFRDVVFRKAIVLPHGADADAFVLRLTALADVSGDIALAIRCSSTKFQVNHVEARCTLRNNSDLRRCKPEVKPSPGHTLLPLEPARALYENILFQSGRFARVQGFHVIEARRCSGQLTPNSDVRWFSEDLPQVCLLGDPGIRDAALHAIQACIPHKIVIPIAVESIDAGVLDPRHSYRMVATEVADLRNELVYDLTISDQYGAPVERWRKITLRVMGDRHSLRLNSPPLMAPFIERQVAGVLPTAGMKVSITPITAAQRKKTASPGLDQRPDGKPDPSVDGRFRSAAYSEDWKLAVDGAVPVGCDLERVRHKDVTLWASMLGKEGLTLAEMVAGIFEEQLDVSATRVWTAREAMKKAGLASGSPLVVEPLSSAHWVEFSSGDAVIYSSLVDSSVDGTAICVATAMLVAKGITPQAPHALLGQAKQDEHSLDPESPPTYEIEGA